MAIKIAQICDGCGKQRHIRHIGDVETFQWIEFYDGRYHMCPGCIHKTLNKQSKRDIYDE